MRSAPGRGQYRRCAPRAPDQARELRPRGGAHRVFDVFDQGTIDNAIERIDSWYGADPARLDTPVLGVLWRGLVEAMKAAGQ
jgi:hypothetical protein